MLGLEIPVDDAAAVEHVERLAQLPPHRPRLPRREGMAAGEHRGQGIAGNIFLQLQHASPFLCHLIDPGQMGRRDPQELPVGLGAAAVVP